MVVNDIDGAGGERVVREIVAAGGRALFCAGDVGSDRDVAALVRCALDGFGDLDIVVNNAGTTHRNQPMLDVAEEEFDRIYRVNVKSLFLTARHAVPHFRAKRSGVFITIASTAGVRPRPGLTWYNGSKGAAIVTSRSMAAELAPDNIRVNVINPVAGETGMLADFMGRGHARDAREIRRVDSSRPAVAAVRHRDRRGVLRLGRGRVHHRRVPRGRRRALRLALSLARLQFRGRCQDSVEACASITPRRLRSAMAAAS